MQDNNLCLPASLPEPESSERHVDSLITDYTLNKANFKGLRKTASEGFYVCSEEP